MTPRPKRSYIICTTPRSGSTLLCKMLAATKLAGQPESHFHTPSYQRWLAVYDLDEGDYLSHRDALRAVFKAAIARGTGHTDVFGLRMQRGSFDYFRAQLALLAPGNMSDTERIQSVFGQTNFVHLTRPDRLGQAISRVRAEQTGLWHRRSDGSELQRLAPANEPHYDPDAIEHHMKELSTLDVAWERWFEEEELDPLRISYDALSDDPQNVLSGVLSALRLDPKQAQVIETPTAKLADTQSLEWRVRFKNERLGIHQKLRQG